MINVLRKYTLIIILLCLAVIGITIYFHSKPDDHKVSWNTYTNQKYGFQLNYPPDWQISNLTENTVGLLPLQRYQIILREAPYSEILSGIIGISFEYVKNNMTLADYVNYYGWTPKNQRWIKVAGVPALELEGGDGYSVKIVIFKSDKTIFMAGLLDFNYDNILNEILSQFRLLP
jgi:hypothetical protein